MYNSNNPFDLAGRQQAELLLMVAMPVIAWAVFLFNPAYTAPILAVAMISTIAAAEDMVRTIDFRRTGRALLRVIGIILVVSVIALGALGVVIIHGRTDELTFIVPGALVGALLALGLFGLVQVSDYRPRLARYGVAFVFLVLLVAGVLIVSHLSGLASLGRLAAHAASGTIGFFVVVGLFLVRDLE